MGERRKLCWQLLRQREVRRVAEAFGADEILAWPTGCVLKSVIRLLA